MKRDPGLYDYLPYDQRRPKIRWPNGARVAFWLAPNIEFYELDPPKNPTRGAWPRPAPDVLGYSYRDYGNRVGFWRMLEAFDRCGVRGSVSLNVAMCEHHPEVIEACAEWAVKACEDAGGVDGTARANAGVVAIAPLMETAAPGSMRVYLLAIQTTLSSSAIAHMRWIGSIGLPPTPRINEQ